MSDHARPAEIEDVLSSIRRLVAGDPQSEERPATPDAPQATSEDQPPQDDALVLTPSLLVKGEEDPEAARRAWDDDAAADSDTAADPDVPESLKDTPEDAIDALDPGEVETVEEAAPDWEQSAAESDEASADLSDAMVDDPQDDLAGEPHLESAEPESTSAEPYVDFGNDAEQRKSPFLSDTLIARRAAEAGQDQPAPETRRSGFGFAGARRDDPVRHVPLSDLGPADPAPADPAPVADDAAASDAPRGRTLHLNVATDGEGDALPSSEGAPSASSGPLISPGFAIESARGGPEPVTQEDGDLGADDTAADPQETDDAATLTLSEPEPLDGDEGLADVKDEAPLEVATEVATEEVDAPPADTPYVEVDSPDAPTAADPEARSDPESAGEVAASVEDGSISDVADDGPEVDFLPDAEDEDLAHPVSAAEQAAPEPPASDAPILEETVPATVTEAKQEIAAVSEDMRSQSDGSVLNVFGEDAPALDEEALRALISEVVHKELQGALGERVSNNIRLLIRREVARELAALAKDVQP